MLARMTFADADLAAICNSGSQIDRRWGAAAGDVRLALGVLAAAADLAVFHALPNIRREGEQTVFEGDCADVVLSIGPGNPRGIQVVAVDARIRARRP